MIAELAALTWPAGRIGEALEALAGSSSSRRQFAPVEAPTDFLDRNVAVQTRWLSAVAATHGLEVEPVEVAYSDVETSLRAAGPALIHVAHGEHRGFLVLLRGTRRSIACLAPDLTRRRVAIEAIRGLLCEPVEATAVPETEALLDDLSLTGRRRTRARAALLAHRLGGASVGGCWLVRLPPGARVQALVADAGLWPRFAALLAAHAAEYALWIVSWWFIGRTAIAGRLDREALLAWALILSTVVPLQLLVSWLQGSLAIHGGALLKKRLLQGALRLDPDEVRLDGAGHLLGRILESQAVEALTLSGGFLSLVAIIEVAGAIAVLCFVGIVLPVLLAGAAVVTGFVAWRVLLGRRTWTGQRVALTHELIEAMIGHRTRAAQGDAARRHDAEDYALARYIDCSTAMDRAVWLLAIAPRGWLLLGVIGLGPVFAAGGSPDTLAVAVGGILLGYRALARLTSGLVDVAGAAIAWQQAAPAFHAAARPEIAGSLAFSTLDEPPERRPGDLLIEASGLDFRFPRREQRVLDDCMLQIRAADRILLQGPSGGGKSTLASVLTGMRDPQSGLLLLDGFDRQTIGLDAWRRRLVTVPQFHENHILMGTLAFNLLMGRDWPPEPADLDRADHVCRALGLGDLLDRMPGGLMQVVGETGWQLSHGERSRVFIARALLQSPDLVIFDESFAQLDPATLQRALSCVLAESRTVMVVAHP